MSIDRVPGKFVGQPDIFRAFVGFIERLTGKLFQLSGSGGVQLPRPIQAIGEDRLLFARRARLHSLSINPERRPLQRRRKHRSLDSEMDSEIACRAETCDTWTT